MSEKCEMSEAELKEQRRAKKAAYNAQPHMKEYRRAASIKHSKEMTLVTTINRLQKHTMDELLQIARLKCLNANVPWEDNKEKFIEVLRVLHGSENV
jgi:hypothetical protein